MPRDFFAGCPPRRKSFRERTFSRNREIVYAAKKGISVKEIARRYNLCERHVYRILELNR